MGTTCSRGPKYIYVLDSSGNGFAAADMDPWDWDRLMSFIFARHIFRASVEDWSMEDVAKLFKLVGTLRAP